MSKLTLEDIERILDDSDDSDDENEEMMDVFAVDDVFLKTIRSITYKDSTFFVNDYDKSIFRWYKIKIPKQDISRSIKYFLESDVDSKKKKLSFDLAYDDLTTVYYYLLKDKLLSLLKRINLGKYYLIKKDISEGGYGKFIIVGNKHNITGEKYREEALKTKSMEFNIKNQRWDIDIPNYFEVLDSTFTIYIKDNSIDSKLKQNGNNVDKIVKELLIIVHFK